ncbi:DNA-binding LytR/AlgR family response regulator [Mucilaginibacter sp. SG538B]|uniref:LytR/AlgR family response regulator transcription factor n=1 Tax=Mucilaginibacter sp. SG538B TaxID=2587021 RepID=UPI00159DD609|nr:LytTR family DNA-binding domain-containing protein [Mucilaginibacter sp. SG538B]NVM66625.1 DNA-binding LytR/AlgR family response regulator [Mucilaginibacter sp. SG538B]
MTVAIIDDEPAAVALLSAYVQRTTCLALQATFTDPVDALVQFNHSLPDLTFLDIDMPGINGIDFARIIGSKTRIVLTTSFREYGPEAYELLVCDYLLKPFSYERFQQSINKVSAAQGRPLPAGDFFYVRTESRGKYVRINIPDVISLESKDNSVIISKTSGLVTALHTLSDIQAWLPAHHFLRIHRSFIINLAEIQAVDHGQVHMSNGMVIPVGRQYREAFIENMNKVLVNSRQ